MINTNNDNCGFAAFIASIERETLLDLRDRIRVRYHQLYPETEMKGDLVIAGEWCGTGIQKKVALVKIPKFLAIISLRVNGTWLPDWEFADICNEDKRIFHIGKNGFYTHKVDLRNTNTSEATIKELTDAVVAECPFARSLGASGHGEGIVWKATDHFSNPNFWFKSKGDLLEVSHSNKLPPSAVDVQNQKRTQNFATAIVTKTRLEQGWQSLGMRSLKEMGEFLKWISNDCLVEEKGLMEELIIGEKELRSAIINIAKPWFLARVQANSKVRKQSELQ